MYGVLMHASEYKMRLQHLPAEILILVAEYFFDHAGSYVVSDLKSFRLVSKRIAEITTAALNRHTQVVISALSLRTLTKLEEILKHEHFATTVRRLKFSVAYYDALLARDFSLFARYMVDREFQLRRQLCSEIRQCTNSQFSLASKEWRAMGFGFYDQDNPTHYQSLLKRGYSNYCLLFKDQETARHDGSYMARLSSLLRRFLALEHIVITDKDDNALGLSPDIAKDPSVTIRAGECERTLPQEWCDRLLIKFCSRPSHWQSCFSCVELRAKRIRHFTRHPPPVGLLPSIFAVLEHANIFPKQCRLEVSTPVNFKTLEMSSDQLLCVSRVVGKATDLSLGFYSIDRHFGPADSCRDGDNIGKQHVYNLTSAFLNTDSVQSVKIDTSLYWFAAREQWGDVKLADILPYRERRWPNLNAISLTVEFSERDLIQLVEEHKRSLKVIHAHCMCLPSATKENLVEYMKYTIGPRVEEILICEPARVEFRRFSEYRIRYSPRGHRHVFSV
ncbi:uncharacterized protein BDCG_04911 [Blastomyces dermatitidis ER-3]|uniref:Uncharacterized protein n=2 Tax=Blastomyces TaxID=229219 RepID=A0A179UTZ0_BLAGS|nr:uncharacterized protein BDBG_06446 [Blastomyces gilchristii SLH14081]XP_045276640.1 uncharacterized protein BDCG_04911 [Blastomyces dermatitidis ER-3]EEQ89791.2 hypothetical protein BDCG_04911 [Blastomyces dermatitidis ER-3]EQL37967.1 hypothetical protein BDFG_00986 [Blastomyces dermatitidis ATCC 26199]OAT10628.1 hypothetical protein BDBG_06446 [Blastomyces gilchristii SLH14081]